MSEAPSAPRKGSLPRTIKAVLWSLLGIRKGAEYQRDLESITPIHIVIVGLVTIFVLVIGLMLLVNWIV